MARTHWLTAIADEIRERAGLMIEDVAAGLMDTVPYGHPVPEAKPPGLGEYLQMEPDMKQAMLASMPNYGEYLSSLQNEAVSKYGAMAAKILPMISMEQSSHQLQRMEIDQQDGLDANLGVANAHAELVELLGIDPFER